MPRGKLFEGQKRKMDWKDVKSLAKKRKKDRRENRPHAEVMHDLFGIYSIICSGFSA